MIALILFSYYEEYFLDSGKTVEEVVDEYGSRKAICPETENQLLLGTRRR